MDERTGVRTMSAGVSGYFIVLGSMLATLSVVCAYLHRFTPLSLIPFVGFVILRLGTGGRGDFIAATVMLVVLFLYDQRRKWPDLRAVAIGLVVVLAFTTVVQDRGAAVREAFGLSGVNATRVWVDKKYRPFEQNDTAMLEAFEFIVYAVPKRSGSYDYFTNNLRIFVEPIPRSWWKDKPAGSPVQFFHLYDYGNPIAMAHSMPGIGWLSMGYIGIVIWSALFAWFYGKAYALFASGRQTNLAVMTYAIVFSTTLIAYRDGLLITIIKLSFAYFIPLVVLIALVRLLDPRLLSSDHVGATGKAASIPRARGQLQPRAARNAAAALVPRAWRGQTRI